MSVELPLHETNVAVCDQLHDRYLSPDADPGYEDFAETLIGQLISGGAAHTNEMLPEGAISSLHRAFAEVVATDSRHFANYAAFIACSGVNDPNCSPEELPLFGKQTSNQLPLPVA